MVDLTPKMIQIVFIQGWVISASGELQSPWACLCWQSSPCMDHMSWYHVGWVHWVETLILICQIWGTFWQIFCIASVFFLLNSLIGVQQGHSHRMSTPPWAWSCMLFSGLSQCLLPQLWWWKSARHNWGCGFLWALTLRTSVDCEVALFELIWANIRIYFYFTDVFEISNRQ